MSKNYDNWERLVRAVARRERDRQLALSHSRELSIDSSSSSFSSISRFDHDHTGRQATLGKFIPAKKLEISHLENPANWNLSHHDGCSSEEVAELLEVYWLHIQVTVKVEELPKATYVAYLVFKLKDSTQNLEKAIASVRFTEEIIDWKIEEGYIVFLSKQRNDPSEKGRFPQLRGDGWMEIKLGEFSNLVDDGQVQIRLREIDTSQRKSGLVVKGIDLRPNFICDCQMPTFV